MKKMIVLAACFAVLLSLTACVPQSREYIEVGPDLSVHENVEFDFTQLHNETLDLFAGKEPYLFITDVDITGSNEEKMIYVKATCLDDVTADIAAGFASAVLKYINDAACVQDVKLTHSDNASFGGLWDKFGVQIDVYTETEAAKENGTPVYSLKAAAGEATGLDPDVEAYEAEWERQMEILQRNED